MTTIAVLVHASSDALADHAQSLAKDLACALKPHGVALCRGDPAEAVHTNKGSRLIEVTTLGSTPHAAASMTLFVSAEDVPPVDLPDPNHLHFRSGGAARWNALTMAQARFSNYDAVLQPWQHTVQIALVTANPESPQCVQVQRELYSTFGLSSAAASTLTELAALMTKRLEAVLYLPSASTLNPALLAVEARNKAQLFGKVPDAARGSSLPRFASLADALNGLDIAHQRPNVAYQGAVAKIIECARRFEPGTCVKAMDDVDAAILSKPFPCVVLLTAPAGSGLTTLASELVRRGHGAVALELRCAPIAPYTVGAAYFFDACDSGFCSSKTAILSIAHQLRSCLPALDLPDESQIAAAASTGPAVLLEVFVLKPCRDLKRRDVARPVVIVLDGLDECAEHDELALALRTAWHAGRPPWLVLVCTAENSAMLSAQDDFVPIVVKLVAEERMRSIKWFLERRGRATAAVTDDALARSEGNFLWAALNEQRLADAPKGLQHTYADVFAKLHAALGGEAYATALATLLLAPREPVPVAVWERALKAAGLDAAATRKHVCELLLPLLRGMDGDDVVVAARHCSSLAFLSGVDATSARGMGKEVLAVGASPDAHGWLARACEDGVQSIAAPALALGDALSPEQRWCVRHCAFHLMGADELDKARLWFVHAGLLYRMVAVARAGALDSLGRVTADAAVLRSMPGQDDVEVVVNALQLAQDALACDPRQLFGQVLARIPAPPLSAASSKAASGLQRKPSAMASMIRGMSRRLSSRKSMLHMSANDDAPVPGFSLMDRLSRRPSRLPSQQQPQQPPPAPPPPPRVSPSRELSTIDSAAQQLRSSAEKLVQQAAPSVRIARPAMASSGLEGAQGLCRLRIKRAAPVALSLDGKFCVVRLQTQAHTHSVHAHVAELRKRQAGSEFDDSALVLDASTGEQVFMLRGHTARVTAVAIAGRLVLTGSADRSARLYDLTTGRQIKIFKWHRAPVSAVALSHNGLRALTGSTDHTACVWNIPLGRLACELGKSDVKETKFSVALGRKIEVRQGHHSQILSVALAHDGSVALTGAVDCVARLWDTATGRLLHALKDKERRSPVTSVAFVWAPPERKMALTVFNDSVAVWSVDKGEFLYSLANGGGVVSLASNGPWVVTGSRDAHVRVWDAETGRQLLTLVGHTAAVTHVAVADKGATALSRSDDGTTRVWEIGAHVGAADAAAAEIACAALSPDAKWLATGDVAGVVAVHAVTLTGGESFELKEHRAAAVLCVAWSGDGTLLMSSARDKTARVWDCVARAVKWVLRGHFEAVTAVLMTRDQGRVVTASLDETVKIWHNSTGQCLHTMNKHPGPVLALAARNRSVLVGAMGPASALKAWNADTGAELCVMPLASDVLSVAWTEAGDRAVSGGLDGATRVWDCARGNLLFVVVAHVFKDDPRREIVQVCVGKTAARSVTRGGRSHEWRLADGAASAESDDNDEACGGVRQRGREVGATRRPDAVGFYLDPGSSWVDGTSKRAVFRNGVAFGVWDLF